MIRDFVLFGKVISPYMIFALAGALYTLFFVYRTAKKRGLDEFAAMNMLLFSFIGVFLGGHLLYGITNANLIIKVMSDISIIKSFGDFVTVITAIFGGSVFYGGLIGALAVSYIYIRKTGIDAKSYTDLGALAIPLFHTFGRLGCFISGCCYGIEYHIGVTYHYSQAPGANGVMRFPVQLVEACFNFILFLVMYFLYKRNRLRGKLLCGYLIAYPIARFMLEFLRGDKLRGFVGIFSTSQIISLILLSVSLIWCVTHKTKNNAPKKTAAQDDNPI